MYITGCKSGINKNNSEMVNRTLSFDSTILLIEKKVVDLTSAEDLFAVQEFVGIYENPHLFSGDAISFIYRADRTDQQKLIAVYSMQKLSLNEYLKIFEKAIAQFNNSKLSEVVLENIISAPIGKEKIILNNSRNQSVLKLLNELKNNSRVSEKLRYRIEKIITRE
ncbi:MAG: hypothetical protein A1D16_12365 [Flavihumibacter sp. CACIAM 22H1]|nr:MAG: hypothetical protein A1D16_12365 [Flavihumibacter sp. CACIAM 22H1]